MVTQAYLGRVHALKTSLVMQALRQALCGKHCLEGNNDKPAIHAPNKAISGFVVWCPRTSDSPASAGGKPHLVIPR